jgi:hypothetical protein
MISVKSLLNSPSSRSEAAQHLCHSPSPYRSISPRNESVNIPPAIRRAKLESDDSDTESRKLNGEINFPPFEDLDAAVLAQVSKYKVHPLGKIVKRPRFIPYNSEKKDFLDKTGRDGFEGMLCHLVHERHEQVDANRTASLPL